MSFSKRYVRFLLVSFIFFFFTISYAPRLLYKTKTFSLKYCCLKSFSVIHILKKIFLFSFEQDFVKECQNSYTFYFWFSSNNFSSRLCGLQKSSTSASRKLSSVSVLTLFVDQNILSLFFLLFVTCSFVRWLFWKWT